MVYSQQAERAFDVGAGALSEDEKSIYFFDDDVFLVSLADERRNGSMKLAKIM